MSPQEGGLYVYPSEEKSDSRHIPPKRGSSEARSHCEEGKIQNKSPSGVVLDCISLKTGG